MKKTALLAVALATCLGYAPAQAADVVSSNIVGYEKLNLSANSFLMSGIQFVMVGGKEGSLNDLFPADDIPYGTELRFINETGSYQYYRYIAEAYDEPNDSFVPGWADGDEYLVSDSVPAGTGFWVKSPSDFDLVQAGEVDGHDSLTINLISDMFEMVSNPFPFAFNPNAVTWSENIPYGTEIRVLSETGSYLYYRYIAEAYDEPNDTFVPGWADGDEYLVSAPIATVGQGFWIKAPGKSISLTVTSPVNQ